jgi:predicted  nucleic acid-binding Zn-ribbon protein
MAIRERKRQRRAMRKRDAQLRRVTATVREQRGQMKRHEEQLQELSVLRAQKTSLTSEVEQARREAASLQIALSESKTSVRDAESRLLTAVESERQEAASHRTLTAAELAGAQQSVAAARAELDRARGDAAREQAELRTEIDALRQQIQSLTTALGEERLNTADAKRELRAATQDVESRITRLTEELEAQRRSAGEQIADLEQKVMTLRDAHALACSERDAAVREVASERARTRTLEGDIGRLREEFAEQLDAEHLVAADLLSRVWNYVHRTRPRRGEIRRRPVEIPRWLEAAVSGETKRSEPPLTDEPAAEDQSSRAPSSPPEADPLDFGEPSPNSASGDTEPRFEHLESERSVPGFFGLADAPARDAWSDEALLDWGESFVPPASDSDVDSGPSRKPIFAMHLDDEVLVICDDGSVWTKRPSGWLEEPPVPGSPMEQSRRDA